jgi:DNA recombination protein RmuC
MEDALAQKVILATPANFLALLRTIAYGWRQESLAANADTIRRLGADLYERLSVFGEHLAGLGKSLDGAVAEYNRAVGSYEAKVLPGARKFPEMGVDVRREQTDPRPVERKRRELTPD